METPKGYTVRVAGLTPADPELLSQVRYKARIAELEAEVARLRGVVRKRTIEADDADHRAHTAWNDAIEAAASLQINGMDVISPVAKAYILGILRR